MSDGNEDTKPQSLVDSRGWTGMHMLHLVRATLLKDWASDLSRGARTVDIYVNSSSL